MAEINYNQIIAPDVMTGLSQLESQLIDIQKIINEIGKTKIEIKTSGGGAELKQNEQIINQLEKQTQKVKLLNETKKDLEKQAEKDRKQIEKDNAIKEKQAEKDRKQAQKEIEMLGTLNKLRNETNQLIKERNSLPDIEGKNAQRFKELSTIINNNNNKLKEYDKQVGNFQRNVGNYEGALSKLNPKLAGIGQAIDGIVPKLLIVVGAFQTAKAVITEFINSAKIQNEISNIFGNSIKDIGSFQVELMKTANIFGKDYKDILLSTNVLSKQFGITANEALTLINDGLINGADNSGEFLNTIKEYSPFFKEMGLSGKQAINLLKQFDQLGIFSDKAPDALKEATLSLRNMEKPVKDALKGLNIDPDKLKNDINSGLIKPFEALQQVAKKISLSDTQTAGLAISAIFKGAGEDAGQFVKVLSNIDKNFDKQNEKTNQLLTSYSKLIGVWTELTVSATNGSGLISKYFSVFIDFASQLLSIFNNIANGNIWQKILAGLDIILTPLRGLLFGIEKVTNLIFDTNNKFSSLTEIFGKKQTEVVQEVATAQTKIVTNFAKNISDVLNTNLQAQSGIVSRIFNRLRPEIRTQNEELKKEQEKILKENKENEEKNRKELQELLKRFYNQSIDLLEDKGRKEIIKENELYNERKSNIKTLFENTKEYDQLIEIEKERHVNKLKQIENENNIKLLEINTIKNEGLLKAQKDAEKMQIESRKNQEESILTGAENFNDLLKNSFKIYGKLTEEQANNLISSLEKSKDAIINLLSQTYDFEIQNAEKRKSIKESELSRIEENINKQQQLEDRGLANNLRKYQQQKDKKLAEIAKEDKIIEETQKKQQRLQLLAITATNAATLSELLLAFSKIMSAHAGIPFAGVPIAIGIIASAIAAFQSAKQLVQSFHDGTENLQDSRYPDGRDTVPIFAEKGERIVPKSINEKLKGIKNNELPEILQKARLFDLQNIDYKPENKIYINNDNKELIKEQKKTNELLSNNNQLIKNTEQGYAIIKGNNVTYKILK